MFNYFQEESVKTNKFKNKKNKSGLERYFFKKFENSTDKEIKFVIDTEKEFIIFWYLNYEIYLFIPRKCNYFYLLVEEDNKKVEIPWFIGIDMLTRYLDSLKEKSK